MKIFCSPIVLNDRCRVRGWAGPCLLSGIKQKPSTRRAFAGGGYETCTGAGSKLPVHALERIVETATPMLNPQPREPTP